MNKLYYLFHRYNETFDTFVESKSVWLRVWCFLNWMLDFLLYGTTPNDFFAYSFYKLNFWGKNEYITFRRYHMIQNRCNDKNLIKYMRDKSLFNEKFKDFLHRDSLDVNQSNKEEFVAFFKEHQSVFVKDVLGFRGKSVNMYSYDETDADTLFAQLSQDTEHHYIIEGKLLEHPDLAAFHPNSVNTIRIVTVFDDKQDVLHFMFAKLRMGNNGACVDNTHAGGISANIDLETGIINTLGYGVKDKTTYIYHPYTGKKIPGFQIPHWKECKLYIEKAARVVPQVRYVGWDVVVLPDGGFALIEANDNADHDGQQVHNRGMWKDYKSVIKQLS